MPLFAISGFENVLTLKECLDFFKNQNPNCNISNLANKIHNYVYQKNKEIKYNGYSIRLIKKG